MIKKAIIGAGIATLVALFFFGRDAVSYVRTSAGYVKDSVKDNVPLEFEINRARDMVEGLMPEIRRNMHLIAKEEVEVEHLAQRIADAEEQLCDNRQNIMRLKADLATGEVVFQYAGRTYSVDRVKTDLANRFERYKTNEATLESLRQIHQARQASLDAAREKLEGMLAKKRQYQVEVENLEARLQMVAAAKASCDYQFDDSRLGRTKELIAELRKRLDIEATLANAEGYFHDEIPLDETAPDNIVDQITDYFSESLADESSLAVKD